jgi:hypothetical protein
MAVTVAPAKSVPLRVLTVPLMLLVVTCDIEITDIAMKAINKGMIFLILIYVCFTLAKKLNKSRISLTFINNLSCCSYGF